MSDTSSLENVQHHETIYLADDEATELFGLKCARSLTQGGTLFLVGDLGAGKTTLVRGIIRALGFTGSIKSPTYTLVEPYEIDGFSVFHFDLYRLSDPEELEYIGIDDYFSLENALYLIEWPEKGHGWLPEPQMVIELSYYKDGRQAKVYSHDAGLLAALKADD